MKILQSLIVLRVERGQKVMPSCWSALTSPLQSWGAWRGRRACALPASLPHILSAPRGSCKRACVARFQRFPFPFPHLLWVSPSSSPCQEHTQSTHTPFNVGRDGTREKTSLLPLPFFASCVILGRALSLAEKISSTAKRGQQHAPKRVVVKRRYARRCRKLTTCLPHGTCVLSHV